VVQGIDKGQSHAAMQWIRMPQFGQQLAGRLSLIISITLANGAALLVAEVSVGNPYAAIIRDRGGVSQADGKTGDFRCRRLLTTMVVELLDQLHRIDLLSRWYAPFHPYIMSCLHNILPLFGPGINPEPSDGWLAPHIGLARPAERSRQRGQRWRRSLSLTG